MKSKLLNPLLRAALLCWTALVLALPFARAVDNTKPPTIWAFNMSGSGTINAGESVDLNWSVSNNTETLTLSPGIGNVTGTTWITVKPEATTTYVLTARNAAGAVTKSRKITVIVPPAITSFTATPESIAPGQSARLAWSAPGATYYYISADNGSDPGRFFTTSTTVRPRATTTYTLTAYNPAGSTTRTLTLPVGTVGAKPVISSFTATPASVTQGDVTTLAWAVSGATSLAISPDVGAVTGNSVSVTPASSRTYTLSATNANGTTTRTVNVTVTPRPLPLPEISSFTASPAAIVRGQSTTLAWAATGAERVSISGLGEVTGNSVTVSPLADTTYVLTATNGTGSVTRSVAVTVAAPAPTIGQFNATPSSIIRGGSATLSWSVSDAARVTISSLGDVTGNSVTVSPTQTTTYTLTASNESGNASASTTVTVTVPAPTIESFTATPSPLTRGQSATLAWNVTGADRVSISGLGDVTGNSVSVSPTESTSYTLTATNAGGSVSHTVSLVVRAPAPVIHSFNATPAIIERGASTTLSWSVENGEVISIAGLGVVSGTSVAVSPASTTSYTLTVSNESGSVSATTQVTVNVPPPFIQAFQVSPTTITQGESAELTWAVDRATRVTVAPGLGEVSGNSATVSPSQTTTYTLTAENDGGSVTRSVTLTVNLPEPAPTINAFTATPTSITLGASTTLAWDVTGAASVAITASHGASPGNVTGNSLVVSPTVNTTYTLAAANQNGDVTIRSVNVVVTAPVPVINSFTATPASISPGTSSTLNWSVTGATHVTILADVGTSPGNVTGTSLSVSPTQTTTYTLTATNDGGSVTRTVTVTVSDLPPVIGSFVSWPNVVEYGQSTKLYWDVRGAATLVITAERGASPGTVTGAQGNVTVTPVVSTLYTMVATSPGGAVTRSVTQVTVNAAPPPPVPVIDSFTVAPSTINRGDSATLNWSVTAADTLSISPGIGAVTGNSVTVNPTQTTTYTLTAQNQYGPVSRNVTLNVTQPTPPTISSFAANPAGIPVGGNTTLTWTATGATEYSVVASVGASPGIVTGNSVTVSPTVDTVYTLYARNQYGEVSRPLTVTILPPVPIISVFRATPDRINEGQSTTLEWTVLDADSVEIVADSGTNPGSVAATGTRSVSPLVNTTYTIRATNVHGTATRNVQVTVTQLPRPIIDSFRGDPAFIEAGESVTLTWAVRQTTSVVLRAGSDTNPIPVNGNSVVVSPTQDTVYTLRAINENGFTEATFPIRLYVRRDHGITHPRIWLTPTLSEQLFARARANDAAWVALRTACDQWAAMPVRWPDESSLGGTINGGYQYFDYYRPMADLALGYHVAQQVDPTRAAAYAAKGRELLLKMSDPVRHGRESTDSGWSIRAYVPALALGYDWLYSTLHPRERAQVYTEINRWVEWYDVNGFSLQSPLGNYYAGYYCAKALGTLATEGDNPKADAMWNDWLNRIHFTLVQPYHATWLSGGGATDGWNYGPNETLNMLRPLVAARTAKGLDLINHPQHPFAYPNGHAHWMTHFTTPDLTSVDDRGFLYAGTNPTPASAAWATQYAGLLRLANGSAAPVAQQYALDLRALPTRDRAEAWVEFLFHDPAAPAQNYRTALSYRTQGDGQVAMRNSWNSDTVWAAFQAGPYTGSLQSSEMFYDQGSLTIRRGNVRLVVNAWGDMLRHTPGTTDADEFENPNDPRSPRPFNQLYTELYGDSVPEGYRQARRLFNTFYAYRTIRSGTITGFFSEIGIPPGAADTTLSKFEDAGRHVMMRATKLEDLYWEPEPILGWERSVVYVRPQVFVVYDRTRMTSANIDNWMSWSVANAPELVSNTPAATVYDVVDRRAAYNGYLYRGRMTALLPVGRAVTPVNLFNRNKVYRMDIRSITPATSTTWVTVFDAAASVQTAGNATALAASAGNVTSGDVEGAHITATGGNPNAAVLFSRTGQPVTGAIEFRVPNATTYVVVSDLTPGARYDVTTSMVGGQLSVRITAGSSLAVSAEGTLAFDVSPAAP